eukprot:6042469-Karenia_brevis.AAC.2
MSTTVVQHCRADSAGRYSDRDPARACLPSNFGWLYFQMYPYIKIIWVEEGSWPQPTTLL